MKRRILIIILILIFLTGLSLLLYPTVSNYLNSMNQSRVIANYADDVADLDRGVYEKLWNNAQIYNEKLAQTGTDWYMDDQERKEYDTQLNIGGSGVMGYVDIPSIQCTLPIYHGIDEAVLQVAIGHIEGTSLPVGGESTHCVISGHRGLPSAKLFTDLDKLREGDLFMLRVLDETLTYEVDRILVVEPHEVSELEIVEGEDYCTLVTCTPYGINSHRLLVRGHRIDNQLGAEEIRITADAVQIEPIVVAPFVAVPMLIILLILLIIWTRRRR